jgi:sarcosine oxidase
MPQRYRVIVIGCGAIGAATTYWLSRRLGGDAVLALEQYQLGHTRGASEDHSRVIRHAYTRQDYTALTSAAYQSWNVAERETGLQLVHRTGGLIIAARGSAGMEYVEATAAAMAASGLPFELLSGAAVSERWPQWRLGGQHTALFDPESGRRSPSRPMRSRSPPGVRATRPTRSCSRAARGTRSCSGCWAPACPSR